MKEWMADLKKNNGDGWWECLNELIKQSINESINKPMDQWLKGTNKWISEWMVAIHGMY